MYVSTLLEILHPHQLEHGAEDVLPVVSTLLEILPSLWGPFGEICLAQFQPFLRFYSTRSAAGRRVCNDRFNPS